MSINFLNYAQVLTDFQQLLANATLINGMTFATKSDGTKAVFKNAEGMDFEYANMPLADCTLKSNNPLNTGGNTYYHDLVIGVEIACFDMTSRDVCATMRDNLTNAVQRLVQANPHFSANVDTVVVGQALFEATENKAQGQFIAAAILEFHVKLYSEN